MTVMKVKTQFGHNHNLGHLVEGWCSGYTGNMALILKSISRTNKLSVYHSQ